VNQHHVSSLEVMLSDVVSLDVGDACSPVQVLNAPEMAEYRLCASGEFLESFLSPRSTGAEDDEGKDWEDDEDDDDDDDDDDWDEDDDEDDDWDDDDDEDDWDEDDDEDDEDDEDED
jgi:hypothetical protein